MPRNRSKKTGGRAQAAVAPASRLSRPFSMPSLPVSSQPSKAAPRPPISSTKPKPWSRATSSAPGRPKVTPGRINARLLGNRRSVGPTKPSAWVNDRSPPKGSKPVKPSSRGPAPNVKGVKHQPTTRGANQGGKPKQSRKERKAETKAKKEAANRNNQPKRSGKLSQKQIKALKKEGSSKRNLRAVTKALKLEHDKLKTSATNVQTGSGHGGHGQAQGYPGGYNQTQGISGGHGQALGNHGGETPYSRQMPYTAEHSYSGQVQTPRQVHYGAQQSYGGFSHYPSQTSYEQQPIFSGPTMSVYGSYTGGNIVGRGSVSGGNMIHAPLEYYNDSESDEYESEEYDESERSDDDEYYRPSGCILM